MDAKAADSCHGIRRSPGAGDFGLVRSWIEQDRAVFVYLISTA